MSVPGQSTARSREQSHRITAVSRSNHTPSLYHASAAAAIRDAFDLYVAKFRRITGRARKRFEERDWKARRRDAVERFDLYEVTLNTVALNLQALMGRRLRDPSDWNHIKSEYARLVSGRFDVELLETFYNSVTRKILETVGINRDIEFFSLTGRTDSLEPVQSVYKTYQHNRPTLWVIREILTDHQLSVPYEDLERDAALVAREVDLHVWPVVGFGKRDVIEVIRALFYRNKAAYLVGRVIADGHVIPMVLPLYHGDKGIYVDAALMTESEVSIVFSFAFSYFHVEIDRYDELIKFLKSILVSKPVSDLYSSLGYNKHGKTELYRSLHRFVHESREKFDIAPGKEGAVMIGFTLRDFNYVFKVIKDRPCFLRSADITSKRITRQQVKDAYQEVCHRDRAGRMVDTQEFENLRFKKKRFSEQLLREFTLAAKEIVSIENDYVIIKHVYVQRKVVPLPMYLLIQKDPEVIRSVILDFGYFLKDLAAAGVFPYDLFNIWNYGVTSRGRVVLFDYDDVGTLENATFRAKPAPRDETEELQPEEDRIAAMPDEFFVDETERYSGIPEQLKGIFKAVHGDLFTVKFWQLMQARVRRGELFDITPYDRRRRFSRQHYSG